MDDYLAILNVTYAGQNGDLADPVQWDVSDASIRSYATEAVRSGAVLGIAAIPDADFTDFVVDRFPPSATREHRLIVLRPKTPFGVL